MKMKMEKILIIEDNADLAENIYLLLKEHGYNVLSCNNGEEGLRSIIDFNPDLILCDIMLPDINGFKLLTQLKKIETGIPPIFIFLTAKTLRNDVRRGMTIGADDYITKPFTYDELTNAIRAQFSKRSKVLRNIISTDKGIANTNRNSSKEKKIKAAPGKTELDYNGHIFINDKKNPGFYLVKNLIVIKSLKDYTRLYFIEDKKFLLRKRMNYWENYLPKEEFKRIHRQTLINLNFIDKLEHLSSNRFSIILKNYPKSVEVSQRFGNKIKKFLK
jgi:DNA-binding response OmpR family regulator